MIEGLGIRVDLCEKMKRFGLSSPPLRGVGAQGSVEQLLRRIVKRFQGGLLFKAHGLWHHPTLGSRVIEKRKEVPVS